MRVMFNGHGNLLFIFRWKVSYVYNLWSYKQSKLVCSWGITYCTKIVLSLSIKGFVRLRALKFSVFL